MLRYRSDRRIVVTVTSLKLAEAKKGLGGSANQASGKITNYRKLISIIKKGTRSKRGVGQAS